MFTCLGVFFITTWMKGNLDYHENALALRDSYVWCSLAVPHLGSFMQTVQAC